MSDMSNSMSLYQLMTGKAFGAPTPQKPQQGQNPSGPSYFDPSANWMPPTTQPSAASALFPGGPQMPGSQYQSGGAQQAPKNPAQQGNTLYQMMGAPGGKGGGAGGAGSTSTLMGLLG